MSSSVSSAPESAAERRGSTSCRRRAAARLRRGLGAHRRRHRRLVGARLLLAHRLLRAHLDLLIVTRRLRRRHAGGSRGNAGVGHGDLRGALALGLHRHRVFRMCATTRSKPVAMTVMRTSSTRLASMTEPKMMLASSCAASWISVEASLTSNSVRSGPPVMLMRMPVAPVMETSSSSGEQMACCAASMARRSPHGATRAHERAAHVLHDGAHVGEVDVDEARDGDEVGDALDGVEQDLVGLAEGVEHGGLLPGDREQAIVGDGDQRVDAGLQRGDALFGLACAACAPRSRTAW